MFFKKMCSGSEPEIFLRFVGFCGGCGRLPQGSRRHFSGAGCEKQGRGFPQSNSFVPQLRRAHRITGSVPRNHTEQPALHHRRMFRRPFRNPLRRIPQILTDRNPRPRRKRPRKHHLTLRKQQPRKPQTGPIGRNHHIRSRRNPLPERLRQMIIPRLHKPRRSFPPPKYRREHRPSDSASVHQSAHPQESAE